MSGLDASYSLWYSALLGSLEALERCLTLSSNWVKDIKRCSDSRIQSWDFEEASNGRCQMPQVVNGSCHQFAVLCWHVSLSKERSPPLHGKDKRCCSRENMYTRMGIQGIKNNKTKWIIKNSRVILADIFLSTLCWLQSLPLHFFHGT